MIDKNENKYKNREKNESLLVVRHFLKQIQNAENQQMQKKYVSIVSTLIHVEWIKHATSIVFFVMPDAANQFHVVSYICFDDAVACCHRHCH